MRHQLDFPLHNSGPGRGRQAVDSDIYVGLDLSIQKIATRQADVPVYGYPYTGNRIFGRRYAQTWKGNTIYSPHARRVRGILLLNATVLTSFQCRNRLDPEATLHSCTFTYAGSLPVSHPLQPSRIDNALSSNCLRAS